MAESNESLGAYFPKSPHVFTYVRGNLTDGFPSLTKDEERLLIISATWREAFDGVKNSFGSSLKRAAYGEKESRDRVEAMLLHIRALATLAGVEPPQERPLSEGSDVTGPTEAESDVVADSSPLVRQITLKIPSGSISDGERLTRYMEEGYGMGPGSRMS